MTRPRHLALKLAALLLVTAAVAAQAGDLPWQKHTRVERVRPATFSTVGTYTGVLDGQVLIDGVTFRIRPGTQAYLIGVGPIPMSSVPIGSRVQAVGIGALESGTIRGLMVRPAEESNAAGRDMSRYTRVRDESAPQ